jgi:hypothetical protein
MESRRNEMSKNENAKSLLEGMGLMPSTISKSTAEVIRESKALARKAERLLKKLRQQAK